MAFGHKFDNGETGENNVDPNISHLFETILTAGPSIYNPIPVTVTTRFTRTMHMNIIGVYVHRGDPDHLVDLDGTRYDRYILSNMIDATVSGRRLRLE